MTTDDAEALFNRCSNWGRWGQDDELGTLNYITDAKRIEASRLVRNGRVVSAGHDLSSQAAERNPGPLVHLMLYTGHDATGSADFFGVAPHGFAVTHMDALGHMYWQGSIYNGRRAASVATNGGLTFGSILAQRNGIVTRGLLLDVARARGHDWLEPDAIVTVTDLEGAERAAGVAVGSGDAVFVRVGVEDREKELGRIGSDERAGLGIEAVLWLHERQVAVYSGDCIERLPSPDPSIAMPLHAVGLAAMGLALLDNPRLAELTATCQELGRNDFMLIVAPLRIPGATGSPVNPLCIF
jgi:kynurenine formamidase